MGYLKIMVNVTQKRMYSSPFTKDNIGDKHYKIFEITYYINTIDLFVYNYICNFSVLGPEQKAI